jgi:hypothetical protein
MDDENEVNNNDRGDIGIVSDTAANELEEGDQQQAEDQQQYQQVRQPQPHQQQFQQPNMHNYSQMQGIYEPTSNRMMSLQPQNQFAPNHFQFDAQQQQQQQQQAPMMPQPQQDQCFGFQQPTPNPPFPVGHPGLLQFYEAQMRGHAAAYANAAAGAAMAAAQIAVGMVSAPPLTPQVLQQQQQHQQLANGGVPPYQMPHTLPSPPEFFPPSPAMAGYAPDATAAHHGPYYYSEDGQFHETSRRRRSRKRHHRRVPSSNVMMESMSISSGSLNAVEYVPANEPMNHFQNAQRQRPQHSTSSGKRGRRGGRRSWNETTSSDSDPAAGGTNMLNNARMNANNNNSSGSGRHGSRRRNKKLALMASSSSDGSSASLIAKKKPRQGVADSSLLGKTASSALYEFCTKRKYDGPQFVFTEVFLNVDGDVDDEVDGNNGNLQVDMNDPIGGIEVKRRQSFQASVTVNGAEIAKGYGVQKIQAKHNASRRALHHLLPGIEFDQKGLLIKIPDVDELVTVPHIGTSFDRSSPEEHGLRHRNSSSLASEQKRAAAPTANSLMSLVEQQLAIGHADDDGTNGSMTSDEGIYNESQKSIDKWETVLLYELLQNDPRLKEPPVYTHKNPTVASSLGRGYHECTVELKVFITSDHPLTNEKRSLFDSSHTFKAQGFGCNKREAKHSADARLLPLLFPQCSGMKEVKAAAETAIANQRKRRMSHNNRDDDETIFSQSFKFGMASKYTEKLPSYMEKRMLSIFGNEDKDESHSPQHRPTKRRGDDRTVTLNTSCDRSGMIESRRHQLEDRVQAALQKLNDHDEEGRLRLSVPEQLGENDVGRTILRTAHMPGDRHWLEALFQKSIPKGDSTEQFPLSVFGQEKDASPGMTIVLLLCRAIAPYDDPPLGCAVVSIGFSLQRGKLLRIADISSKPHLPKERFLECLESFASCMDCVLDHHTTSPSTLTTKEANALLLPRSDLQKAFCADLKQKVKTETDSETTVRYQHLQTYDRQRERLQSVKEVIEEEEIEDRSKKRSKSNYD